MKRKNDIEVKKQREILQQKKWSKIINIFKNENVCVCVLLIIWFFWIPFFSVFVFRRILCWKINFYGGYHIIWTEGLFLVFSSNCFIWWMDFYYFEFYLLLKKICRVQIFRKKVCKSMNEILLYNWCFYRLILLDFSFFPVFVWFFGMICTQIFTLEVSKAIQYAKFTLFRLDF